MRLALHVCRVPESLVLMTNYFPSSDMAPWGGVGERGWKLGTCAWQLNSLTSRQSVNPDLPSMPQNLADPVPRPR